MRGDAPEQEKDYIVREFDKISQSFEKSWGKLVSGIRRGSGAILEIIESCGAKPLLHKIQCCKGEVF